MQTNSQNNAKLAALLGSFLADSFSLGPHWIYDTDTIDKHFGRPEELTDPPPFSMHKNRKKGQFTHYGDQSMVLLELIADRGGFDLEEFGRRWLNFLESYDGYLDHAMKDTGKAMEEGKGIKGSGSQSTDLGGASRIAPLVFRYAEQEEELVQAARDQTLMTHARNSVADSAEFFARAAVRVLDGTSMEQSIQEAVSAGSYKSPIEEFVQKGIDSISRDSRSFIKEIGQMCAASRALPATVHLVLKYSGNYHEALIQNVLAGGDSSARGMLAGMILGAESGLQALPPSWIEGTQASEQIQATAQMIMQKT